MRFPGLRRKGDSWQYRRRTPRDLLQHYGGREEIVVALGRIDPSAARIRAAEELARLEREFHRLRRGPDLGERIRQELTAPLRDTALSDDAKLQVIREGAEAHRRTQAGKLTKLLEYWIRVVNPRPRTVLEAPAVQAAGAGCHVAHHQRRREGRRGRPAGQLAGQG